MPTEEESLKDLDFSRPAPSPLAPQGAQGPVYSLAEAMEFFRIAGKAENVDAGATIFVENEKAKGLFAKRDKMYLLLEGEVSIVIGGEPFTVVKAGEIFGEMAAISESPRSATAIAQTACRLISLDDKGFNRALREKPEFSLALLGIMIFRLRRLLARLEKTAAAADAGAPKELRVFDKSLLSAMERGLGESAVVRFWAGHTIMTQGHTGAMMYVVLEGRVALSIGDQVIERAGPGGVFGEMALLDQSPRAANAVAEADCTLLTMNRNVFLQLVKTNPEFAVALLTAAAERVRYLSGRVN
jgi:CRP-like cAMP-binding protein